MADDPITQRAKQRLAHQRAAAQLAEEQHKAAVGVAEAARQRWPAIRDMIAARVQAANDAARAGGDNELTFTFHELPQPGSDVAAGRLAIRAKSGGEPIVGQVRVTTSGKLVVDYYVIVGNTRKTNQLNQPLTSITPTVLAAFLAELYCML